jgi:hypothetical protein
MESLDYFGRVGCFEAGTSTENDYFFILFRSL